MAGLSPSQFHGLPPSVVKVRADDSPDRCACLSECPSRLAGAPSSYLPAAKDIGGSGIVKVRTRPQGFPALRRYPRMMRQRSQAFGPHFHHFCQFVHSSLPDALMKARGRGQGNLQTSGVLQ